MEIHCLGGVVSNDPLPDVAVKVQPEAVPLRRPNAGLGGDQLELFADRAEYDEET